MMMCARTSWFTGCAVDVRVCHNCGVANSVGASPWARLISKRLGTEDRVAGKDDGVVVVDVVSSPDESGGGVNDPVDLTQHGFSGGEDDPVDLTQ